MLTWLICTLEKAYKNDFSWTIFYQVSLTWLTYKQAIFFDFNSVQNIYSYFMPRG